uniref:RING-type domain-containing protein n=1 Tax=Clastoptera arizonana TaxID=38151 RepID=A0A1B6DIP4_9HEMI
MAASGEILLLVSVFFISVSRGVSSDNWSNVQLSSYPNGEVTPSYYTAFINLTYVDPASGRVRSERAEIGKFGEDYVGFASGVLVHVKSSDGHTGCTMPLRSSVYPGDLPRQPWVALIKRGDCSFQVKVDNAYRSNASAVIVYNNEDSNSLEKMMLKSPDRRVRVAVLTYKWKGQELARLLDNGTEIITNISIGNNCRVSYNINSLSGPVCSGLPLQRRRSAVVAAICGMAMPVHECAMLTSVLFVSISFIVLMIISLAWLVFYYIQRFRYIHAKDRLSRRLCSAAKKALSKIPTKHIKSDDKGEGECCAICIEPYKTSDIVRILPCRHEFHRSCIDPWLLEHRTCPMCKMDILKHYGFVNFQFTGSQESILHMDIEEAVSDSESLHRPSLSPVPQIRSSDLQTGSSGVSEEESSHLSRPSTPNELTPALSIPGPSSDLSIQIGSPKIHGGLMVMSTSEFLSANKSSSQLRRSVSLDNCDLPSNSQSKQ